MSEAIPLAPDERALLREAVDGPILCELGRLGADREAKLRLQICLNLASRQLMQRATPRPGFHTWPASATAFMLTRAGWAAIKLGRMGAARSGRLRAG